MSDSVLNQGRAGYQFVVQLHIENRGFVVLDIARELTSVRPVYCTEAASGFDMTCRRLFTDLIDLHSILFRDDIGSTEDKCPGLACDGPSDSDTLRWITPSK